MQAHQLSNRWRAAVLLAVGLTLGTLALFALAACGGDDGDAPAAGGTPTPAPVPVAEGVTLAATWRPGDSDNPWFGFPSGIAIDASGNVYVLNNLLDSRLEVFSPEGRFLRNWGSFARLGEYRAGPLGVAVDASGNGFVVERFFLQ